MLSAGSSLPTQTTLDAVVGHLRREAEVGGYRAADEAHEVLEQGGADFAALIGGEPAEIAYAPSDSVGWVKAWWEWVAGGNVPDGGVVLIDRLTCHSHYAALVLGQLEIDVRALGCHVLTGTGRKYLRGPRGSVVLWVAAELIDRFQPPGTDATSTHWTTAGGLSIMPGIGRFEEYEVSYASMVGLASAARQALTTAMTAVEARVTGLVDLLRAGLDRIDGVTVHDTARRRCGIVTFSVAGVEPAMVVDAADRHGISINASTAPWAALDMDARGLLSVVRASPHYFNTERELQQLLDVVDQLR